MHIKEPMLAAKMKAAQAGDLEYPLIAQPKIDGYRGLLIDGKLYTRKFLRWANLHIRQVIEDAAKAVRLGKGTLVDGEIIIDGVGFNEGGGKMRKSDAKPVFRFVVFDFLGGPLATSMSVTQTITHDDGYSIRLIAAELIAKSLAEHAPVEVIDHRTVRDAKGLLAYEARALQLGFEGVCMRTLHSPYKEGRSTLNEGYLVALKRFVDDEAIIESVYEQMLNTNAAGQHKTGGVKRSRKREGLVPKGILGGVVCRWKNKPDKDHPWRAGPTFNVATFKGLTLKDRAEWWQRREELPGKPLTVTFQEHGMDEDGRPRTPIGKYIRPAWDCP